MTKLISTALFSKSFSQDSKNQVKITEKKREKNYPSQEDFMSELFLCLPITANAVLVMEFMAKILRRFGSIEVTLEEIQNATKLKTKTATKTTLKKLMAEGFLTTTNKFEKNSHKKSFSYKFTDLIQCFFDASKVRKKLAYVEKKQRRIKKQYKLDKLVKIQKHNQELLDGYLHYYNRLKREILASQQQEISSQPNPPEDRLKQEKQQKKAKLEAEIKAKEAALEKEVREEEEAITRELRRREKEAATLREIERREKEAAIEIAKEIERREKEAAIALEKKQKEEETAAAAEEEARRKKAEEEEESNKKLGYNFNMIVGKKPMKYRDAFNRVMAEDIKKGKTMREVFLSLNTNQDFFDYIVRDQPENSSGLDPLIIPKEYMRNPPEYRP